ncbi:MAG: AMP-binding protein [Symploca sp. SIO2E6]|nr:AMP-binding protein [Symploca sp. SIO2E6]
MNNLVEFLQNIYHQGWQLWSENGQLCYDAPQDKSTDSILATLKQHKTEILQLLSNIDLYQTDGLQPVAFPLTEAQKQFWFLDQLEENSRQAYVDQFCLELEGVLDGYTIEQAIQKIVERHEALRTRIDSEGNFQEVLPTVNMQVPLIDFSNSSANERESQVAAWLEEEIQKPFNLSQAPLLRAYLLKLEEKLHWLVLRIHHIINDGLSIEIIFRELAAFYSAQDEGKVCQLEQPMQFREYVEWQNQISQTQAMTASESYWLAKFSGSIPVLDLPTDRSRPPIMTYGGSRQTLKLDGSLFEGIKRVSKQQGCTLFMTLLATYKIFLGKLTGEVDIVIGTAARGRALAGSKNLIGYCNNVLPIRSSIDDSLTFSEFLSKIRGILLDDYQNQDYPFPKLLNQLNLERDHSRPVLFSTLFNLDRIQVLPTMSGLKTKLVPTPKQFVPYDLVLDITETEAELLFKLDYNLDLFDKATINRWLSHFQTLLAAIVTNPEQKLGQLSLMTKVELEQLLVEWNNTKTDYPREKCIHQLFEEQVEKTPDAVAVVFEQQKLTYSELNSKANQLANYLQKLGVVPESLVGICVERSVEMVVGLLATLKAGGAYVPLDPSYPPSRLNYMIEDAQLSIILTKEKWQHHLSDTKASAICLDTDSEIINQQSQQMPENQVAVNQLAYLIYTSGSTGQPKGVTIAHQGLLNLVFWHQRTFEVTSSDKASQIAGVGFDASVWEIWPYLSAGASLHLVNSETRLSPEALRNWLISEQITISFLPTPLLENLCTLEWPAQTELRSVLTGGDRLQNYPSAALPFRIFNNYGPTENTVVTTSG